MWYHTKYEQSIYNEVNLVSEVQIIYNEANVSDEIETKQL